jgi:hypothetical protein
MSSDISGIRFLRLSNATVGKRLLSVLLEIAGQAFIIAGLVIAEIAFLQNTGFSGVGYGAAIITSIGNGVSFVVRSRMYANKRWIESLDNRYDEDDLDDR